MRREGRSVPPVPVCSCARFLCAIAHETAGAACTRSSLRPLFKRVGTYPANLGRNASRDHRFTSDVQRRHCEPTGRANARGTTASRTAYIVAAQTACSPARERPRVTTFRCNDKLWIRCARPTCKSLGQRREQSGVTMSLFKMRMTGPQSDYFLFTRSD